MQPTHARPEPPPLPKRFYRNVSVAPAERGWRPLLDQRPIRTPGKAVLELPHRSIADAIAEEWRAQVDLIRPATMPLTRLANSCIDGVAPKLQAVADDIAQFAASDLLCYRADTPQGLVTAQNDHWNPLLAWAERRAGGRFLLSEGVMPVRQPAATLAGMRAMLPDRDAFALGALHSLTALTGSAIIALAVAEDAIDIERAWQAAHVDEDWNIRLWGEDAEAAERRARRFREAAAAALVLQACRPAT